MAKRSAGLLVHRSTAAGTREVLLVHPGGPFWARRDEGAWSIPKGEYEPGEDPLAVAYREFAEEIGQPPPPGPVLDLGELTQPGGKRIVGFAVAGDLDVSTIESNPVEMEWPRRSGRIISFPEVDRAGWFDLDTARRKLLAGQVAFLDRLQGATDAGDDHH